MRQMTEDEIKKIDDYTEKAYNKALQAAKKEFGGVAGLNQHAFIDKTYHRLMNAHAAKLGLRVI